MRHARANRKLGRRTAHRLAMFRNQIASLVDKERIITTLPKAKELRPIAERVITQSKRGTVHARRLAGRWLGDRDLLKKLFDEIGPRMKDRPGGYLRIVKLGHRAGDAAELAVLELVDYELPAKVAKPTKEEREKARKAGGEEAGEAEAPKKEKAAKGKDKEAKDSKAKPEGKKSRFGFLGKKGSTPRKAGGGS
jgi:large subunit ribosomal protein L17